MRTDRETTRIVRSWLDEGATHLPDEVLGAVLAELPTVSQRRATPWRAWRVPTINAAAGYGLAAAAAVAAILGVSYLVAPNVGAPNPADLTTSPQPSASELALEAAPLDPGRYALADPFPVRLTFELRSGWDLCPEGGLEQGICASPATSPDANGRVAISFVIVDNVVENPCAVVLPDPGVGPTVDDLVAAITSLRYRDVTEPVDTRVGGFPAKRFTITHPESSNCGNTWATTERTNGTGPTEINDVYVVDAGGTRVLIAIASYPDSDAALLSAAQEVIASIQIEP